MIVGGPVVTVATARLPRRALLLGLVAVAVLANLGSALAPGYSVLLATRFAAGLVVATFFAVAVTTAIALTALGNVGVVMVFTYITPLLTEVAGFAAGRYPSCCWSTASARWLGISWAGGRPIAPCCPR
ncbi:hypothetical protein [Nocardia sp. IFM 10818]